MASALDMPLDDLIKANKQGARGGGGSRGRGRGANGGGGGFRGAAGGYGDSFSESVPGPIRRDAFLSSFRAAPYISAKRDSDGPWKHDLFEDGAARNYFNESMAGIETGTKVLISNLDYAVSDEDIKELFSEVGDIKWSFVRYDRSGRSEGSAEVLYSRRADAETAVKRYHNVQLDGKPMKVQIMGTNLTIPAPAGHALYETALAGRGGRRVPGMIGGMQGSGGMPQKVQVRGNGEMFQRGRGHGRGHGKEELEKIRSDLDAELERYHAEAKKSS